MWLYVMPLAHKESPFQKNEFMVRVLIFQEYIEEITKINKTYR